jgi:Holliday junction DNA helicase RuvA
MLISVSGVGPKAALSVLSSSTPESLAMAIITDDERALTVAPGIGKRIAQRVILELKDKVSKETILLRDSGFAMPAGGMGAGTKLGDAAAALVVLGYSQSEISQAMKNICADDLSVEEIIRLVLKNSIK